MNFPRQQLILLYAIIADAFILFSYVAFILPARVFNRTWPSGLRDQVNANYANYMEFLIQEGGFSLVILVGFLVIATGTWIYRGYRDDWEFLYD